MNQDGKMRRAYNGKLPEQFTEADTLLFMVDSDIQLFGKESSETLAAIKKAGYEYRDGAMLHVPGKENKAMNNKTNIGAQTPAFKLDVSVRVIEPMKNLVGFATVKFNDCFVVEDFKVLTGEKGLYIGMPSKPDKTSKSGYRDTAKPITAEFRGELQGAILEAYGLAVEKLQARANAIGQPPEKQSIKEQLENGAKQATKENAARPPKEKPTKAAER